MKRFFSTQLKWDVLLAHGRWHATRVSEELGRVGVVAAFAIIAMLAYRFCVLGPDERALRQEQQALSARWQEIKAAPAAAASADQSAVLLNGDPVARKFAIFDVLKRHAVMVEETTYQTSDERDGKLSRRSMVLAGSARYPDLVGALQELRKQPFVTVDELTLERNAMENDQLRVVMHVSLLARVS
ncbi:hypothetical protein BTK96_003908 [Burkholderia pyrrocinia]|uniref:hypothetical protein n=1 Tax=Burkholderia TaxID=32008 RepID=UPI00158A46EE|nr:hypothetical protein [Burkholderia cenocepacia]EKS9886923.1 hypothetical protein [Burkholderia pyrrocinia]EKS9895878.1 hypothetical protein [Burkholderia pyrrocinia]EKS9908551.1 hypothetical protein [Burkholderia pyrrocinia]